MPYADPEKRKAAKRRWEREHPEMKAAQDARSYQRHKEQRRAQQNAYWGRTKQTRAEVRRRYALKLYGLTEADYDGLLLKQGGCCAICLSNHPRTKDGRRFAVDHDHKTGRVRGLLCGLCNSALGKFQDDPEMLRAAMRYLERDLA